MFNQALPEEWADGQHLPMKKEGGDEAESDSVGLAERFNLAFPRRGRISDVAIAKACGVKPQAVWGWRGTGRIAKKHLNVLSELSGRSQQWWLGGLDEPQPSTLTPRQELVLFLWQFLPPAEEMKMLDRLEAARAAQDAMRRNVRGRLAAIPSSTVAAEFGKAKLKKRTKTAA